MFPFFTLGRNLFRIRVPSYLYVATVLSLSCLVIYGYKNRDNSSPVLINPNAIANYSSSVNQLYLNDFELIKPLLFAEVEEEDPELATLKSKLDSLLQNKIKNGEVTNASVYLKRMSETRGITLNQGDLYNPGSMMKIPVMITYYREAMNNNTILRKKIVFPGHNAALKVEEGAVSHLVKGNSYSVEELIRMMIIDSDNDAMGLLVNNISTQQLNKVFADLNIPIPSSPTDHFKLTPELYSRFFQVLYNASYLDRYYSQQALSILTQTKYAQGLTKNRNEEFKIAHKYGISTTGEFRTLSEAGIFYTLQPYLFVIMTKGGEYSQLANTISECSDLVYSEMK